ncbi:RluA family pseudouridine synthase [Nicoliella spurrieriana]|uniref:Pseudouridine synthase n=1 Tax=Nicoliella spurrieriana TaxID=2925830 RepID=A0A976X4U2_9LACO|nr:RluA family pseudouridine synthase [Nicoliella spurrieriana]UQS86323.1 RluA family pseudouridine synthase [Nicoliella spurrieriana]
MIILGRKEEGQTHIELEWQYQNQSGNTLKSFLKQHGISHRMFLSLRATGDFRVNDRSVTSNVALHPGDVVKVSLPAESSDPNVVASSQPLDIIHEDANWLVVNKPAGLTSVPGPSNRQDTLVNRIKGHLLAEGSQDLRPHLITRLDRFTSGVVLVAKHRIANSLANQQVMNHAIEKHYLALAQGAFDDEHGLIDFPIGKQDDEIKRHRMAAGQSAKTEYWVVKRFSDYTQLLLQLHTGRTHQIRVHLSETGHPLLGDQLYGGPLDAGIDRQALHACSIKFYDPFSERFVQYEAPIPNDIAVLIDRED